MLKTPPRGIWDHISKLPKETRQGGKKNHLEVKNHFANPLPPHEARRRDLPPFGTSGGVGFLSGLGAGATFGFLVCGGSEGWRLGAMLRGRSEERLAGRWPGSKARGALGPPQVREV